MKDLTYSLVGYKLYALFAFMTFFSVRETFQPLLSIKLTWSTQQVPIYISIYKWKCKNNVLHSNIHLKYKKTDWIRNTWTRKKSVSGKPRQSSKLFLSKSLFLLMLQFIWHFFWHFYIDYWWNYFNLIQRKSNYHFRTK